MKMKKIPGTLMLKNPESVHVNSLYRESEEGENSNISIPISAYSKNINEFQNY